MLAWGKLWRSGGRRAIRMVREGNLVGAPTLRGPRGVGLLVSQIEEGFLAALGMTESAGGSGAAGKDR